MYYLIKEQLVEATAEECAEHKYPYVALITAEEFNSENTLFDMGVDMEITKPNVTRIEVNYDSLTGCFSIPKRDDIFGEPHKFAYAMDEKGIAFIDDDGYAARLIEKIMQTRKWRNPSLERFLYDFLEKIVTDDLQLFERYDKRLDEMEDEILAGNMDDIMAPLMEIRGEVLEIHTHYEQLLDVGQELQENENNFFSIENLRYFDMFENRVTRLNMLAASLRERVMQVRDLYDSQMEVRQNKISTVLTIVATIFMPLTLIVGWYGMNFTYMPELSKKWSYPIVIAVCIMIVIGNLIFFRKKKWL